VLQTRETGGGLKTRKNGSIWLFFFSRLNQDIAQGGATSRCVMNQVILFVAGAWLGNTVAGGGK